MSEGATPRAHRPTSRDLHPPHRGRALSRRAAIALVLLACVAAPRADAQEKSTSPTIEITAVRAGFDGLFKVGCWTPFEVTLQGGAGRARGRVEMTVADGDGVPSRVHAPVGAPIAIEPGATATVTLYAKIGQIASDVTVAFRPEDGSTVTRRFTTSDSAEFSGILPTGRRLIVTLGRPLSEADLSHFDSRNARVAQLDQLAELPVEWFGWESVDTVIVATGSDDLASQLSSDSPQLAALDQWVRMGGSLVLSIGRQAEKVLASTSPLATLVPGRLESMVPLRQSMAIETFAETSEPVDAAGGPFLLQVPKLIDVLGKIEAYAGSGPRDLPLVVRAPHGFGEVVFLAVDLEQTPISTWVARPQLLDRLLHGSRRLPTNSEDDATGQVTTLGFVDLAGQLRGALDQFEGVRLVPFWIVALLIVLYIAAIGPLDYYLVTRVFRRPEATWVTFAATVLAFCAGAFFLTYALKGREVRANRVDLVDFDAASGRVRGTSWLNLFSPTSDMYQLALAPSPAGVDISQPRMLLSWLGLPGSGFGGMNASTASLPLFTAPYDFAGTLDRLDNVPLAVWSTKAFGGRWWGDARAPIAAELADNGRLVGTLTCNLSEPLDDCVLIYDTWAYPLRQLQPGQRIDVETQLDPQTVETFLRHVTVRGDRDVAPPYDRGSFDVPRIVEIMSCHELAGGETYTGLSNDFQEFTDLSELVRNGRAILLGRRAEPATRLNLDGAPLDDPQGVRWTFYRFVFPVQPADAPRPTNSPSISPTTID